jgi:hypothetical protein
MRIKLVSCPGVLCQLTVTMILLTTAFAGMPSTVPRDTISYLHNNHEHPPGHSIDPTFECKWRQLAYVYGQKLQSWRGAAKFQDLYDALQLQKCTNQSWSITDVESFVPLEPQLAPVRPLPSDMVHRTQDIARVFVDPHNGSDANTGHINSPYRTITRALATTRISGPGSMIMLRKVSW